MRGQFDLEASAVLQLMPVAKIYGERKEITSRLSWRGLVALSSYTLPEQARRGLEKRILAGECISVSRVEAARARGSSFHNKGLPRLLGGHVRAVQVSAVS